MWLSELLPHTAQGRGRDLRRALDAHGGDQSRSGDHLHPDRQRAAGPASIGSWLSYGLGSENQDLPAFIVLISQGSGNLNDQPLFSRLWGSGFLPSSHQGVKFRSKGDPVLYLNNPPGIDRTRTRARCSTRLMRSIAKQAAQLGDPEIETRIAQYEMAYRMQASVPELMDLSSEPRALSNSMAKTRASPGPSPPMPARAAAGRARRAFHPALSSRLGPA